MINSRAPPVYPVLNTEWSALTRYHSSPSLLQIDPRSHDEITSVNNAHLLLKILSPLKRYAVSLDKYVVGSKSFWPDQLFKVTEIKQLCYFST